MSVWLKNVTQAWAETAEMLLAPEEVVIWHARPDRTRRYAQLGDLVLFRRDDRSRDIVGYGRYVGTTWHTVGDAWTLFGTSLGTWTADHLLEQLRDRVGRQADLTTVIAHALVAWPVFFPPLNPFELPATFSGKLTTEPLCPAKGKRGRILLASLRAHGRQTREWHEAPQERLLGLPTYRVRGSSLRIGSQSARSLVAKLYGHRCAITGERISVTQHVAHVRPRQYGGADHISNLMLLNMELHRLWDEGLIGVDEQHRVMVSVQLRLFGSSDHLSLAGRPLRRRLFGEPYPSEANLRWHREKLFKGPKIEV